MDRVFQHSIPTYHVLCMKREDHNTNPDKIFSRFYVNSQNFTVTWKIIHISLNNSTKFCQDAATSLKSNRRPSATVELALWSKLALYSLESLQQLTEERTQKNWSSRSLELACAETSVAQNTWAQKHRFLSIWFPLKLSQVLQNVTAINDNEKTEDECC